MKSSISLALVAVAAALLTGCGSVKLADPARSNELKQFTANKAVGQVYVCRNSTFMGAAVRPTIEIDGQAVGAVGRNNFSYTELAPGNHTVVAKSPEHDSKMDFTIAAGEQKFFQTWISMGVFVGWGLIDAYAPEEGKKCVTEAELVEAEKKTVAAAK
jgi:hypothetical protein